ncbi:MAG TPA: toll/interleukin-1 receptor domain-containing protein [Stellaceae bacterium]|nr:toll/interleukin-1 receptor domain-containing protein [Stellaceae bacterium]
MPAPVFISHSSRDKATSETLCAALEQRGIACWISSRDITPGQNFQEAIVKALTDARVMVLVFSSHANSSDEIKKELALASQNHLAVVPVRVEDVLPTDAFKYELATRQWIDVFKDWEVAVGKLAEHIGGILGEAPKPAPATPVPPPPAAVVAKKSSPILVVVPLLIVAIIAAAGAWYFTSRPTKMAGPDPTGQWVSNEFPNVYDPQQKFILHFEFDRNGDTIGGVVTETAVGRGSVKRTIRNGHIAGDLIEFHTPLGDENKEIYRGVIRQGHIEFTRSNNTASGGDPEKFVAKREEQANASHP